MLFEVKYKVFVYRNRVLILSGDKMTRKPKKIQVGAKKTIIYHCCIQGFLR